MIVAQADSVLSQRAPETFCLRVNFSNSGNRIVSKWLMRETQSPAFVHSSASVSMLTGARMSADTGRFSRLIWLRRISQRATNHQCPALHCGHLSVGFRAHCAPCARTAFDALTSDRAQR
jgi:hypothetical protein